MFHLQNCTNAWIIDYECSYYMKLHRVRFNSFKLSDFDFVCLGDNKTDTITIKGEIKIALDDGGVHTLSEVHYVPELRKKLIFLGTIQSNDYSFLSDINIYIMLVSKGATTMMTTNRIAGNIYKLSRAQLTVM